MRKPKVYFTILCRNKIWISRGLLLGKTAIFFSVIYYLIQIKQGYLLSAIILFLTFFFMKFVPMPHQDTIDVYYDRMVYKSKFKEIELNFNNIAFIDQDVVDEQKGSSYYQSIEFLDESMNSLLYIEGSGYSYDELVVLCNRILVINQEIISSNKTINNHLSTNFNNRAEFNK